MSFNQKNLQNQIMPAGKSHWIIQRITAILLLITLPTLVIKFIQVIKETAFDVYNCTNLIVFSKWTFVSKDVSLFSEINLFDVTFLKNLYVIFVFCIILIHAIEGLENVILDYVHDIKIRKFVVLLIKCIQLFLFKFILLDLF